MKKWIGIALFGFAASASHAAPITEPTQLASPQYLIDFNSLTNLVTSPVSLAGGVTITGTSISIVDTDDFAASSSYPSYVSGYALGIPQDPGPGIGIYTIAFASPVWQVGFGLFDPNFAGTLIRAFNAQGALLETTSPDALFPTGGSGADYVGFVRGSADIARIEITPGIHTSGSMDALWIDNLAFSTVPAPGLPALLALGLAGLVLRRRAP
jgi:hypothetical protein